MSSKPHKVASTPQYGELLRLTVWQLLATVVFSLMLLIICDQREAISALLGGLVVVISSAYFTWQLYRSEKEQKPEALLVRFYTSEVLKVVFSLAIMAIMIIVLQVSVLPFIMAYLIAAVIVNWLVLLLPGVKSVNE